MLRKIITLAILAIVPLFGFNVDIYGYDSPSGFAYVHFSCEKTAPPCSKSSYPFKNRERGQVFFYTEIIPYDYDDHKVMGNMQVYKIIKDKWKLDHRGYLAWHFTEEQARNALNKQLIRQKELGMTLEILCDVPPFSPNTKCMGTKSQTRK